MQRESAECKVQKCKVQSASMITAKCKKQSENREKRTGQSAEWKVQSASDQCNV